MRDHSTALPPLIEPAEVTEIVAVEGPDNSPRDHTDAPLEDTTANHAADDNALLNRAPSEAYPQGLERKKEEHHAPSTPSTAPLQVCPSQRLDPIETVVHQQHQSVAPPSDLGSFHPFQLLLPLEDVPDVPETIECVYDDEAVEMQKNIMKVVRKLVNKNRAKLEDFKINSRLFGNNFMEPYEYIEAMAKDFGASRSLQLVPCLASIQPDFMKRSSLLVAARSYRLRNFDRLSAEIDRSRQMQPSVPAASVQAVPAEVHILEVPENAHTKASSNPAQADAEQYTVAVTGEAAVETKEAITSHLEETIEALSTPIITPHPAPSRLNSDVSTECVNSTEVEDAENEHDQHTVIAEQLDNSNCVGQVLEATADEPVASFEEDVAALPPPKPKTDDEQVSALSPTSNKSSDSPLTADTTASSPTESSSLNMFGEEISVDSGLSTPSQSAFFEAETLFGESFSWSSSKPEPSPLPAAEAQIPPSAVTPSSSVSSPTSDPVVVPPPLKPTHSAFLFGMATAGASDSDSDSDFSD
ncbi:hypothetical protein PINS_up003679 [Pythium insidiosum]|nr:hypothetical protein PINS_up003679 [Pythium insidiosum]